MEDVTKDQIIEQTKELMNFVYPLTVENKNQNNEIKRCKAKIIQHETRIKQGVWMKYRQNDGEDGQKKGKSATEIVDLKKKLNTAEEEKSKIQARFKIAQSQIVELDELN